MTKKKCDCLFCAFKCPECGSAKIEFTYQPAFVAQSDGPSNISVYVSDGTRSTLDCRACGGKFEMDIETKDRGLGWIEAPLEKVLGFPRHLYIDREKARAHGARRWEKCDTYTDE